MAEFHETRGGNVIIALAEKALRVVIDTLPRIASALERQDPLVESPVNSVAELLTVTSGKQRIDIAGHWKEVEPGIYHFSPIQSLNICGCPMHISAVEVVRDRSIQRNRYEASELEWGAVNLLCNGNDSQTVTLPQEHDVVLYVVPHRR